MGFEPMTTGTTNRSNSIHHQYYYGTFDRVTLSALSAELTPPYKNTIEQMSEHDVTAKMKYL